jgi:putative FmdB family regulatory protein
MLKIFDFECPSCQANFEGLVENIDGQPEGCPQCSSTGPFRKLPGRLNLAEKIIVDHPGSKKLKAGYQHTHNRPAEKKNTQFSMYTPKVK